ncbi:MAG: MBL fold metallo-hydrolase [Dehalococcoidia bacterium]
METARKVTDDIHILPSFAELPGLGMLPVNGYVLKAKQPLLVDTGLMADHDGYLDAIRSVIDPSELKYLWLTHPDPDHTGALDTLLAENPQLKLVTTFLGLGILSLTRQIPLDRLYFVNPGETLDLGDRQIVAVKPPTFDNPSTTGFFDPKSRAFFSSDCFGAVLQEPAVFAEDVRSDALREGQVLWTTVDAPWIHNVDEAKLAKELQRVRELDASWLLSSHVPPSSTLTDTFLGNLASVPSAQPFVGPNQAALEAMMAQMMAGTAPA